MPTHMPQMKVPTEVNVLTSLFNAENRKKVGSAIYTYVGLLSQVTEWRYESKDARKAAAIGTVLHGHKLSAAALGKHQGVCAWTIQGDIRVLKELGVVRAIGGRDSGYSYEVVAEDVDAESVREFLTETAVS